MKGHATVDRLEGSWAILLRDGQELRRRVRSLPEGIREGDVVDLETMTLAPAERASLEQEVQEARDRAAKGPKGSFDL